MANNKKVAVKPVKSVISKTSSAAAKQSSRDSKKLTAIPKRISVQHPKKPIPIKKNSESALVQTGTSAKQKRVSKLKSTTKKVVKPITALLPEGIDSQKGIKRDSSSVNTEKRIHQELRTRYSDNELEEFKQLIIDKLDAARRELKYLQDQINRRGDNGTDDTENKFASSDDGSSSMEREYLNQMAARQIMYMDHLNKALVRIRNKTYGICRVTGKLIEKDRLKAVPHATLSMEAKRIQSHS